jgi:VWFA-related protein
MSNLWACGAVALVSLSAVAVCSQNLPPLMQQPPSPPIADSGTTLQVEVRAVLVPVVVRDATGHAVGNLTEKDFKVFDQGKKRTITGFNVESSVVEKQSAQPVASESITPGDAAPAATAAPKRYIVFLFDDRHMGPGDLLQIEQAGKQMLDGPLPDQDRAVVLSFGGVNSGMTHDHTVLQAAVMKLKAGTARHMVGGQCPDLDYYTADQILNKHSKSEWDIAYEKAANCSHQSSVAGLAAPSQGGTDFVSQEVRTAAQQAIEVGDQDVRETLVYVRDVVHTMRKLPGQRTLILISPGFYSGTDAGLILQSQILDLAGASNVTISALDPQGLANGFVGASESTGGSPFANITGQPVQDHLESFRENEDIMAELAAGTGGIFFHNGNNLAGGLSALEAGPEYRYLLEISLQDVKPDGAFHALKVEVNQKDMKVQAREGYFAPRLPSGKKSLAN